MLSSYIAKWTQADEDVEAKQDKSATQEELPCEY